ncbi:unnamed protein product [Rotaria sp. Silwood1]|nr:unnamed protein product [Rotaria sp. Silwood1]
MFADHLDSILIIYVYDIGVLSSIICNLSVSIFEFLQSFINHRSSSSSLLNKPMIDNDIFLSIERKSLMILNGSPPPVFV